MLPDMACYGSSRNQQCPERDEKQMINQRMGRLTKNNRAIWNSRRDSASRAALWCREDM